MSDAEASDVSKDQTKKSGCQSNDEKDVYEINYKLPTDKRTKPSVERDKSLLVCPGKEGNVCGHELNKAAKFCSGCGWKIDFSFFYYKTIKCPKCEYTIDRANKFCSECGWKVDQSFFKKELCNTESTGEDCEGCQCVVEPQSQDKKNDDASIDQETSALEELRIVLIGKTGVGKSRSGNNILGKPAFKSEFSGDSVTKLCQLGTANRFGKRVYLVDTPGMFDGKHSESSFKTEIAKCVSLTSPGLHAIIFVVQVGRYTIEDQSSVDNFLQYFGEDSVKYLIMLFTHKNDLEINGTNLKEFIDKLEKDSSIAKLIQRCEHRCIAFENFCKDAENDVQVRDLFMMIETLIHKNQGIYSNEMYDAAEKMLKRTEKKMLEEMKAAEEKEIQEICRKDMERKQQMGIHYTPEQRNNAIIAVRKKYERLRNKSMRERILEQCTLGNFTKLTAALGALIGLVVLRLR